MQWRQSNRAILLVSVSGYIGVLARKNGEGDCLFGARPCLNYCVSNQNERRLLPRFREGTVSERILLRERVYNPKSTLEFNLNILEIIHRWADVQSSRGYNYLYPTVVSAHMKEQYCRLVVYRWLVWTPGYGMHAYYVGETDNLAR